jgi:hypothetical protein
VIIAKTITAKQKPRSKNREVKTAKWNQINFVSQFVLKNLLDSSAGPKRIESSSNRIQHEAFISAIHINALSAVKFA